MIYLLFFAAASKAAYRLGNKLKVILYGSCIEETNKGRCKINKCANQIEINSIFYTRIIPSFSSILDLNAFLGKYLWK